MGQSAGEGSDHAMTNLSMLPLDRSRFDEAAARHLLTRAGFGGTSDQVQALAKMGLNDAVGYLVEYEKVPEIPVARTDFNSDIRRPPTAAEREMVLLARRSNDEAALEAIQRMRNERDGQDRTQLREMQKWWLKRMIETGRPLEEKMTLFWHGHFATGYRTVEDSYHMFLQNGLFRSHATGNFADLVLRILRYPAMLKYLDNDESRRGRPNENLARELMELFVLGEGHAYTEQDIKEGARALTGYTFSDDTFTFNESGHDDGEKTILGQRGNWDGDDFARIILSRKECSEFICGKLYRFFVNDAPGMPTKSIEPVIKALASELRKKQYDLKSVLTMLFKSQHFYDEDNRGSSIKSPVQLTVQTIRELGVPPRDLSTLNSATDLMGQALFQPPNVKGWDTGRTWINTSTLFVRQNLAVYLITGKRPDAFDWDESLAQWPTAVLEAAVARRAAATKSSESDALLDVVLATNASPDRRAQFKSFTQTLGGDLTGDRLVSALCLLTAVPEFQLC